VVRECAPESERPGIDGTLVKWLAVDLGARAAAGAVGAERILAAAGPAVVGAGLAPIVAVPGANRKLACDLLGRLGDAASRDVAGGHIVADLRREPLKEDTLMCLGQLAGPAATGYLLELARKGGGDVEARAHVLHALALHKPADPQVLPSALRTASDPSQPGLVREAAFGVIEAVGGPAAVSGLLPMLGASDRVLAQRAIEAALAAGQATAVMPVLEQLPPRLFSSKDDFRDYLVRDIVKIGPSAAAPLRLSLKSGKPLARLAAVVALGELGSATDVLPVSALERDTSRLPWQGPGQSIGTEARAIVEKLKNRR
jgi:hypothetical protein